LNKNGEEMGRHRQGRCVLGFKSCCI